MMERLLTWAVDKGAKLHKLTPQARHFVVTEDVQAGDTLISIPQRLLLHTQLALDDAEYAPAFRQLAAELGPQLDDRHLLCLLLVLEKARQGASAWEPYITILPEEYDDPYWWTDEQLQLVKGTRLGRAISMHYPGLEHITTSLNRLEQLHRAMRPPGSAPSVLRTYRGGWALQLGAARWARSAVWSRSFTVRMLSSGARNVVAMVPVLDMIDHSPSMEVVWHTGRDGTEPFQFVPLTAVCKGAIMCNNYGRKSSDELLLAYGFLLEGPNAADHLIVSLSHSRMPLPSNHARSGTSGDSSNLGAPQGAGLAPPHGQYGPGPMSGTDDDGGDEDQAAQQQAAEDLQRTLALASLNLAVDQKLGAADPLPAQLLLGAQLCLLPPSQLYLWTAQIQAAMSARLAEAGGAGCAVVADAGDAMAADAGPFTPPTSSGTPTKQLAGGQQWLPAQRSGGAGHGMAPRLHEPLAGHKRSWNMAQDPLDGEALGSPGGDVNMVQAPQAAAAAAAATATGAAPGGAVELQGPGDESLSLLLAAASAMHIGPLTAPRRTSGWSQPLQGQPQVHLSHQLQALVSMREQLQSRLQCMAGEELLQAAALHVSTGGSNSAGLGAGAPATATRVPAGLPSGVSAAAGSVPHSMRGTPRHSQLAMTYVQLQRALVHQSLATLAQQVSLQVHAAAEPLAAAHQQHLIKWAPLGAGPPSLLPPDAAAPPPGAAACTAWGSIDPDAHILHYSAWLRAHGLAPRTGAAPASHHSHSSSMDVSPAGMDSLTLSGTGCSSGSGGCVLQEVVHTRAAPPRFLARRSSSREVMARPSDAAAAGGAPARPGNGRVRGPPSSSRTFTMKGQQPQPSNPSGALPAGATATPTAGGEAAGARGNGHAFGAASSSLKRVSLPQGLAASMGIDSDHDPIAPGVLVTEAVQRGQVLLEVPLECCLCAPTKQQLVCSLMASANQLLLSLVAAIRPHLAAANTPTAAQGPLSAALAGTLVPLPLPQDMLTWHLMHSMAACASARLALSDVDGVQLLLEMLEDSPAGGAYQEAFDNLKNDFLQLRAALCKSASGAPKDNPLARLLALNSTCCLYFWASHVVERCAKEVPNPWGQPPPVHAPAPDQPKGAHGGRYPNGHATQQHQQQQQQQQGTCWVLAPILSWIPGELRQAMVAAELQPGPSPHCHVHGGGSAQAASAPMADANATDPCCCPAQPPVFSPSGKGLGAVVGSWSGGVLCARAACDLQAGLHLSPLLLLANQDVEDMMQAWGPEALPWQQLLHRCIPRRSTASGAALPPGPRSTSGGAVCPACQPLLPNGVPVVSLQQAPGGPSSAVPPQQLQQAPSSGMPLQRLQSSDLQVAAALSEQGAARSGAVAAQPGGPAPALRAAGAPALCHNARTVLYELYICPGERDPLVHTKLLLLAAAGLGCVHYLTEDLVTEHLVMCALKICLADQSLLQHPLAQQCIQLHAAARAAQAQPSSDAAAEDGAASSVMDCSSVLPSGAAGWQQGAGARGVGEGGPGSGGVGPGGAARGWGAASGPGISAAAGAATAAGGPQEQLQELQARLLGMLAALPEEHPVCKASRKQLRQMVHDARKNTRRRLKQLETVHNVVASHTPSNARGASYGVVSALGGSYHALGGGCALHEGVRLYLQGVCDVLDTWADHLGLNRQSDSMNKRHKSRPDD